MALLKFLRKKRSDNMNSVDVATLVGELLPLATSLVSIIEKIRTDSPDAWAQVTAQYGDAVKAWQEAKPGIVPAPDPQAIATATSEIVEDIVEPADPVESKPPVSDTEKPDPQFNAHLR